MTYEPLKPWPPLEDFMDMPLKQRIRFIRTNLPTRREGSRIPHMSLDEFATTVGATGRHRPIGWEKGQTPRDYAESISCLTPYPASALGGDGAEDLLRETLGSRLRSVESEIAWLRGWVTRGFEALEVAPELRGEAPPPRAADARPEPQDL